MTSGREPELLEIAAAIADTVRRPTNTQRQLLARLQQQALRLRESVLQLAVLGQFKRGKSTLLNAFVGEPLLSAGVLPLTSVPTFLKASPALQIRLSYESGVIEDRPIASIEELTREIAAATTEEQNPHNVKGLQRVDVDVPGNSWLNDVTLIDTPGIGSTHTHNTDTAYAVLPECDAALFVCSVDPPITEVERAYLARICRTVPRVIVVLNKIDLVDGDDLRKATNFLSEIVADRTEADIDRRVFAVSARAALIARRKGDQTALEASGLIDLERHIRATLLGQKRHVLELSIANKMAEVAAALAGDAAMTVSALTLPFVELETKIEAFEEAVVAFGREHNSLEDALNGEWHRAVAHVGVLCEEVEKRTQKRLEESFSGLNISDQLDEGRSTVAVIMIELFERESEIVMTTVKAELDSAIETHQRRYQALAARVRETAGALLNVPVPSALPTDWFRTKHETYWVSERQVESLSSLTADGLAWLLPPAWRRKRQKKRFREAVYNALMRNISALHWTMQQNINDSFRSLLGASREVVQTSIDSTHQLLTVARRRRQEQDVTLQDELERARFEAQRLADLQATLERRFASASGLAKGDE